VCVSCLSISPLLLRENETTPTTHTERESFATTRDKRATHNKKRAATNKKRGGALFVFFFVFVFFFFSSFLSGERAFGLYDTDRDETQKEKKDKNKTLNNFHLGFITFFLFEGGKKRGLFV
tara:strand:+ start:157 stop:519 length:363 start_codon:yes stop_codon:yes gene_type:complete